MARRGLTKGASPNFDESSLRGKPSNIGYSAQPALFDIDKIAAFLGRIGARVWRLFRR